MAPQLYYTVTILRLYLYYSNYYYNYYIVIVRCRTMYEREYYTLRAVCVGLKSVEKISSKRFSIEF